MIGFSVVALAVVASSSGSGTRSLPRMLVPAYFDPPSELWRKALTAPARTILIVNADNGPGRDVDPAYKRLVARAQAAGHELIGYVHTSSGARPPAAVERDIDRWRSFYRVHDIFFDEVSDAAGQLPYYRAMTAYARMHGAALMVLNPGTVPTRGYFGLSAIVVTFEDTYAAYRHARFPRWLRRVPASQQANIVYAVPTADDARATLAAMHARGVGVGYVTGAGAAGGNPYSTLPAYYAREPSWLAR